MTPGELRAFLREHLPEAWIPSRIAVLDALPLTPNGKVDRAALARLGADLDAASRGADGAAPSARTATEELLAAIWGGVLGRESVGLHDDFFDLGGHSLLATQLVSRVREAFAVELPQRALFEEPTVAGLAARIDALRGGEDLLPPFDPADFLALDDGAAAAAPPRLSFAQERLWILDQIEPGGNAYNIPLALRLVGDLRVPALAAAFTEVVRRHEALRTTFATILEHGESVPVQVIHPVESWGGSGVPLPVVDLTGLPGDAGERREAEVREIAQAAGGQAFDLTADLMLRGLLVRLGGGGEGGEETRHALFLTLHHIAADGWSGGVLVREMVALYEAFAAGRPSPLPPLPVRYVDYARWQRRILSGETLERLMAYWRRQLAGVPVLDLPADHPRPAVQRPAGAVEGLVIPRDVSDGLVALGRRLGATPFMVLMGAFQALLARVTGQLDVPVGTSIAGRRRTELEGLIGFFVNTLVIRGDLSGDPAVTELLARVRAAALDAFAHQDVPFEKLVEEINPDRSLSHSPLFQALLVLQNAPAAAPEGPGLRFEGEAAAVNTAKFDLTVILAEGPEGLGGTLEYRPDLYDRTTVLRLIEHLQILLAGMVADPSRRVSELPLLADAERQALLEWNDTERREPSWSLEERLARRAALTPDAPALIDGERTFSYAEVSAAAGRLARRLRELGVGPDVRVGVCAERSPEMVAAVLAIVRAGAAYVPLDPAYPAERLALMLGDSAAPVLLTQERLRASLPEFGGRTVLLDGLFDETGPELDLEIPAAAPDNLGYVIYTSGSTGRPKGVALTRRALVNLMDWQETGPLPRPARTLQFASLSFDVSFQEIFSTWLTGGTLVLLSEETRRDPHALLALLEARRIERTFLPVVVLRQLAEAIEAEGVADAHPRGEKTVLGLACHPERSEGSGRGLDLSTPQILRCAQDDSWGASVEGPIFRTVGMGVRDVIAAGEQLQVSPSVLSWFRRLPGGRLHNHYGPSEAHAVTAWTLDGDPAQWPARVPIGRPLANLRIHLLDGELRPVPVGSAGELCVAGVQLARGYLDRPDLTADRFVPDPFGAPGDRLYRVGDLGRWRADGVLEYLGRRDGQVKVRGVRVEIGEVEAALDLHPGVRQAVVLAAPGPHAGDTALRLVAWYQPEPEVPTSGVDLREFLRERLPAAYVPSVFTSLEAFPLTPSGKVDRRALAKIEPREGAAAEEAFVAPRTPAEELLAEIWAGLLGLSRVGTDQSFFDLGGHSLLATQLVSRVRRAFGIELPQRALFEAPTVAELALRVEVLQRSGESLPPLEPITRGGGQGEEWLPRLSFAQERLWLLSLVEPESPAYNLPVALRAAGRLDPVVLEATFAEVAQRHATLRTTYGVVSGGGRSGGRRPVQIVAPPGPVPVPRIDLAGLPQEHREAEVRRLAREEAHRPFDLAAGPVLRVRLVRLGDADHALLLNVHHIASDGWSNGVLVREVTQLYGAFSESRPSPLPELPIQYVDFARWQRRVIRGEVLESTLAYWRRQLAGVPVLELPADRPRPAVASPAGDTEPVELGTDLTAGLQALGRREGATLFMGVMAAFQALLHRYSGQPDFAVGTPVAGRGRIETEGLIGFFVNTLVIRSDFSALGGGLPSFADVLGRVRKTALEAFAHQDLPFEKLVEELNPERSLAHTPLFQVMAALQNTPSSALEVSDLAFAPLETPTRTAKFDLTLSLSESPFGLLGGVEYRTALFEAASVRRMIGHLRVLLAAALAEPGRPVAELPLMPEAEREQILVDWNGPRRPDFTEGLLHTMFEAQAERSPEAPALWWAGATVSYRDLNGRADRLAHRLRELGVGPEVRVGVCQDRSVEMIVAVLGVLKAGGAYVPLDPAYPAERLAFMAEDAGLAAVVVNERTADRAPGGPEVARVHVREETESSSLPSLPSLSSFPPVLPENLAYIIYTSGSTGRPKGVAVPHRGVVNMLRWTIERLRLGPGERFLQFASLSFDGSVAEVFSPLASGACLALIGREALPTGEVLAAALRQSAATTALIPPSVLATLGEVAREDFPALHTLTVSAEKCPAETVRRWAPGRRFLDLYGPTEASVYMTAWEAGEGAPGTGFESAPPIGRPIENTRVFVLDRLGAPVPVGTAGELYLGGVCVTRGYFGRPDRTAEVFVPDPFAERFGGRHEEAGGRLYRTGDLCRWRSDGHVEILGRIDHQVKVRGFRIELGEIESVLRGHPAVRQAAVVSRPSAGTAGGPRLIAYVVPEEAAAGDYDPLTAALRAYLRDKLPDFMVPAVLMELAELPLNNSGKLDRAALPEPGAERPDLAVSYVAPQGGLEGALAEVWQEVLGVERVGTEDNFFDLGGHSLLLVEVQGKIREKLGREVSLLDLFRYPKVSTLAGFLQPELEIAPAAAALEVPAARVEPRTGSGPRDIAVIGMAARFPGAPDLESFWRRLTEGSELISFFTAEELVAAGVPRELVADPAYVRASGVLEDPDLFDAGLFDVSPREAQLMDPQQRILLECAAEALERAGYGPGSPSLTGENGPRPRVGVYAGGGMSSYGLQNLFGRPVASGLEITLGNDKDYLATRVAYKLNLRGPAFTVQTACSTSLVAIHLACQSLLDGECDLALAGGVSVQFPMRVGYLHEEGSVLSQDGHTRTFDVRARGTVNSNGVGVVALKPLAAALADGDPVHAVIKGSAINNDGAEKIGFTAPSEEGQAEVIATAQAVAGVSPETIGYVEAHGTATPMGDPIEVAALTRAFRHRGRRGQGGADGRGFCALGSVKSNLGHTGSAAGVAGFLKAALAVERGEIPPSLGFETPNPALGLEASPFFVPTALTAWGNGSPRRAGVSSFGLGGTNAHVVLEQAPEREPSGPSREWQLLCLSARTGTALEAATDRLVETLKRLPEKDADAPAACAFADLVYTLQVGRRSWEHRRVLVCRDRHDALAALDSRDPRRVLGSALPRGGAGSRPVAFVFSGLGEQYPGMAAGLYRDEPAFREAFDRCAAILEPLLGADPRALLFAEAQREEGGAGLDLRSLLGRSPEGALGPLDRTAVLQPALFAVEYALAELWREWGVEPRAVIGYSLGEYVAACVAGVLSLEDALRLVAERARLIDALPEGAMLAVSLPEAEILPLLEETELSLAAVNGPALCVVAGPVDTVAALEEVLREDGVAHRRLRTTHAFHSRRMAPAAEPFAAFVRTLSLRPPRIPYVSNVTGTWITPEQAVDAGYWAEHLTRPVRFGEGIGELWREPGRVLLEIGPGGSLAALALQHPESTAAEDPVAVSTLRSAHEPRPDQAVLLSTLGKLWLAGVRVGWQAFQARERRRRVELPAYPFERQRYWIEAPVEASAPAAGTAFVPGLYAPAWHRSAAPELPPPDDLAAGRWLVFTRERSRLGERLAARLREAGAGGVATVEMMVSGDGFEQAAADRYRLDPARPEAYDALLGGLLQQWGAPPDRIVHLWTLEAAAGHAGGHAGHAGNTSEAPLKERFDRAQERGFYSLLFLAQALGRWQLSSGGELSTLRALMVSSGVAIVSGQDAPRFENAPLAALSRALSVELPGVVCRCVDVAGGRARRAEERLVDDLLGELFLDGPPAEAVAYRNGARWVRTFAPVPAGVGETAPPAPVLRPGGVLLLLGRIDPLLAEAARELARQADGRVVLLRDQGRLEPGADIFAADLGDEESLAAALNRIDESVGPIEGVIAAGVGGPEPPDHPAVPAAYLEREPVDAFLRRAASRLATLERAFAGRELSFGLLVTSLAGIAAEPGKGLQAALDGLAEAFVRRPSHSGGLAWTAVSWDRPQEAQEAPEEHAVDLLRRLLSYGPAAQAVVSMSATVDLNLRLRPAAEPGDDDAADAVDAVEIAKPPAAARPEPSAGIARHPRPSLRNAYVAPETATQQAVAEMWQGLLGIEPVGLHDSFFDLGGDSLLATQVFSRISQAHGVDIQLATFFEQPTPAGLAAWIDAARPAEGEESEAEKLARVLERLESLSPEEIERMLAERGVSDLNPEP